MISGQEYDKYWKILGLSPGASLEQIKRKRDILAIKFHPDKALEGCTKTDPKETIAHGCGKTIADKIWFCSEKHKKAFEKAEEKIKEVNEAYDVLTSKSSGGSEPRYDTCDYCQEKYDFDRENYPKWKEFQKKNGEREGFHFCNKKRAWCYNNFFFCYVCEKKRTKGNDWDKVKRREQGIFFCSDNCQKIFNDENSTTCPFCQQKYPQGTGVNFIKNPEMVFCSEGCARNWEREKRNKKNLASQRTNFITDELKTLAGWNSLSEEEKENFIEQVNNSESEQFEDILQQAKKLIREKRSLNTRERESKKNNSGESNISDGETDSGYDSNHSNDTESQESEISNLLSLAQSQTKAEEKIDKLLKDSGISEQKLNQVKPLEGIDWKECLKNLDTPQKVEEFVNKIEQEILKLKLSKQEHQIKDKDPKNGWVLPTIILVLSFLALTSLLLIIRKRKQRRF